MWFFDNKFLNKHYDDNMLRIIGRNKPRPDYITLGIDIIPIIEYKPAVDKPGYYHVANAFGVSYPSPDKKVRSLIQVKNMLLRNLAKSKAEKETESGYKIAREIIDWCDNRVCNITEYERLMDRVAKWGSKKGVNAIRKAMRASTPLAEKVKFALENWACG